MINPTLYLASASPRRHEILNQLLIPHHVLHVPAPTGEDEPQHDGESPEDYVRRTAHDKITHAVWWMANHHAIAGDPKKYRNPITPHGSAEDVVILCADTVVILDGNVLGKPRDHEDAGRTLKLLSGRIHQVHTAVAIQRADTLLEAVSVSDVHFKSLTPSEIEAYCNTNDGMGKAGAYGIQGPAAAFVTYLSGSYTGVMGLPAHETVELLKAVRYLPG